MGLLENLLISIVHITLITTDILFMILFLKIVEDRWQITWAKPFLIVVRPAMSTVLDWFHSLVLRVIGQSYTEKTLMVLLMIFLMIIRILVTSIVS